MDNQITDVSVKAILRAVSRLAEVQLEHSTFQFEPLCISVTLDSIIGLCQEGKKMAAIIDFKNGADQIIPAEAKISTRVVCGDMKRCP